MDRNAASKDASFDGRAISHKPEVTTMNTKTTMKKYGIQGLDCAQCAINLESALRKQGFNNATVSFAAETVLLPAEQLERAAKVIERVEPAARIVPRSEEHTSSNDGERQDGGWHGDMKSNHLRVVRTGIAIVIAVVGTVFNRILHDTPFQVAEYAVFAKRISLGRGTCAA